MIQTLQTYFQFPFVRYALIVGVLIALCSSLLGVTLVLRRLSFMGDGLSHVAFGAIAIAAICNLSNEMLLVLPVTVICAIALLYTGRNAKIRGDAAIAMISVGALALGYLGMSLFSTSTNLAGDVCSTLFGSTSNDAAFTAWVTDNTESSYRGKIEGILAILPLLAMLVVAGGFGILVGFIGYTNLFLGLGAVITLSGIGGLFLIRDSNRLEKNGGLRDMIYGFKPSTVKANPTLYLAFVVVMIYGIACQIFMPYMIIYMTTYLKFTVVEYSIVFGAAILIGAGVNLYLTRLSDKLDKVRLLYFAAATMSVGLIAMYFFKFGSHLFQLVSFGIAGCVMITGYIFVSALAGAIVRDHTPTSAAGKLQGIRMIFSVLIPMIVGPMIGNGINRAANIPLPDASSPDMMTTAYIPAPGIYLAAGITTLLLIAVLPMLARSQKKASRES